MACANCYTDYISCGVESIVFNSGIEAVATYNVIIKTPQNATYRITTDSNAFGDITLPVNLYPEQLFNPYAGMFSLWIENGCEDHLFCDYYKYLQFEILSGNDGKNTLTCCPPDSGNTPVMTCCTTTTITFSNVLTSTVPYTGTRPSIEVAYLNDDGVTYTLGSMGIDTFVSFDGASFTIDHGGLSTGIIKLLK